MLVAWIVRLLVARGISKPLATIVVYGALVAAIAAAWWRVDSAIENHYRNKYMTQMYRQLAEQSEAQRRRERAAAALREAEVLDLYSRYEHVTDDLIVARAENAELLGQQGKVNCGKDRVPNSVIDAINRLR
jgi:hypothetical protein